LTISDIQMVLALVGSLREGADGEIDEALNMMSNHGISDLWWARRIAADLESTEGPVSYKDIEGNGSAVIVEIAFWAGWLRGQLDTLDLLDKSLGALSDLLTQQTPP
jgi:hypothetical protein